MKRTKLVAIVAVAAVTALALRRYTSRSEPEPVDIGPESRETESESSVRV